MTTMWARHIIADPASGAAIDGAAIVIENGTVSAIEQRPSRLGDTIFEGCTLLPGLFDMHIHLGIESHPDDPIHRKEPVPLLALRCARNAQITLHSGVTTCRDAGTRDRAAAYVRDAAARGLLAAPRLLSAGRPLGAPEGHCNYMTVDVRDAAGADAAVRTEVGAGADWIKLMVTGGIVPPSRGVQLDPDAVRAAVATAHQLGVRVMAHTETAAGARLCVDAGVDTVEHGVDIDDETLGQMAQRQLTLVPTLMAFAEIVNGHNPALAPATVELARAAYDKNVRLVERAHAAGVPIAAGTDGSHGSIAYEVQLLAEAGLGPAAALVAATQRAAAAAGLDTLGQLRTGSVADCVIVEGNPLADVSVLRHVRAVLQSGHVVHMSSAKREAAAGSA